MIFNYWNSIFIVIAPTLTDFLSIYKYNKYKIKYLNLKRQIKINKLLTAYPFYFIHGTNYKSLIKILKDCYIKLPKDTHGYEKALIYDPILTGICGLPSCSKIYRIFPDQLCVTTLKMVKLKQTKLKTDFMIMIHKVFIN